jgi:hypothetical protein
MRARLCRHTDETLRAAVALWFGDNAAAVARYGPIGDWDTRDVRSMRALFQDRFSQGGFDEDIGRWNVGSVEDMGGFFHERLGLMGGLGRMAAGGRQTCHGTVQ